MATGSIIGALRVVLGADTAALDKGLKDSQSKLGAFGVAVTAGMAAVAAGVGAAAVKIGMSVQSAIDSADKLNKASQSTGLTTQEFSKLAYAAELADVPVEALGKSMGKLSKAMVEAAGDGASQAGRAFAAMGVAVKDQDGTLRSSADVMADLAEKFAGYKDGAEKTALAIALFGKAGAAMIPLLNLGRDGLKESADEAERYGLVLDKKTTAAAEAFNDNLKRMDKLKQGIIMTVTAKMLPAFEELSKVILKSREESTLWNAVGDAIAGVMNKIVAAGIALITTWQRIFATASDLKTAFGQLSGGQFSAAWDTMTKSATDTANAVAGVATQIRTIVAPTEMEKFWAGELVLIQGVNKEVQDLVKSWSLTTAPIVASGAATKDALQTFLDAQAKRTAGQEAEAATIGKSVGEQAKLRLAYEATALAQAKGIELGPQQLAQIAAAGDAAAAAAMKIEAANISMQVMNPAEKFASDMARLQEVYLTTNMTMETFAARQQQIAEQAGATWGQASASMAGSFAKIAGAFGKESAGMAKAAKVFGVIQGTISMFTGAAKALELPFPANLAAMATVLAQGASLVASIKSQSVPAGFMTGGSFTVGGSGGPDSKMVQMALTPGEQVDVWRPDDGGRDPRARAQSTRGTIDVSIPAVLQPLAVALFPYLNEAIRDGHELKLAPA